MTTFRFQFEKRKMNRCPRCGQKRFKRIVDVETGRELGDHVGACNRENSCGYRFMAKDFFAENGGGNSSFGGGEHPALAMRPIVGLPRGFDYHDRETVDRIIKLNGDKPNTLATFLYTLFADRKAGVASAWRSYRVGTFPNKYRYFTLFPYIDRLGRVARGKLMVFDPKTGKRKKGKYCISSLKTEFKLSDGWNYDNRVFFGEHLIVDADDKPICIVESEKTALIMAIEHPEAVWIATGTKLSLSVDKVRRVAGARPVILLPDGDAIDKWTEIAVKAWESGLNVKVSAVVNDWTEEQRKAGIDIADMVVSGRLG